MVSRGSLGMWRGENSAMGELGEKSRVAKNAAREDVKAVRRDIEDDQRVWKRLKELGSYQRSKFKNAAAKGGNRDQIRAEWGMSPEAALEAFDRLVAIGRISVKEEMVETRGGQQKVHVARASDSDWPIGTEMAS